MVKGGSTEWNSHETPNIYLGLDAIPLNAIPLNDQQRFRLNTINEIKYYFVTEIKERELMSITLSKCNDYFDKSLIALFITTDSISIASFETVIGAPLGIKKNASSSLAFSISTGIIKKTVQDSTKQK